MLNRSMVNYSDLKGAIYNLGFLKSSDVLKNLY